MSTLVDQIRHLEQKSEYFDSAVERIMELGQYVDEVECGEASPKLLISKVNQLIKFYKTSSRAFLNKLEVDGFQKGELEKYVDSTFNDEKIISVKVLREGQVYVETKSGEHYVADIENPDEVNYTQGLDYILCDIQFTDGLELIK